MNLATVESEYIRNLQQQVYFLELENDYLREQTSKMAELPPSVALEAEKMMQKIKVRLQCDTLHDLLPFAQFKKVENTHGKVLLLVNFTKNKTPM